MFWKVWEWVSCTLEWHCDKTQECVTALFKRVNIREAAGPDASVGALVTLLCCPALCGLHYSDPDVCRTWSDSFNLESIIPPPKIKEELNEFRPVALPSLVMKTFQKILKDMFVSLIHSKLDTLQFAYQACKGVADAKNLHSWQYL